MSEDNNSTAEIINTDQQQGTVDKNKHAAPRKHKAIKAAVAVLIFLIIVGAVIGAVYYYIQYQSIRDMQKSATSAEIKEGIISYNGECYQYNSNMINMLGIGIDTTGELATENVGLKNGQADTLFLLAIDPVQKTADVIAVNRNAMTTFDVYSLTTGEYVGRQTGQITLSYGYGGGGESSCEATVKAVSELLHDIPISGYYALNKEAIIPLNDAVGGVRVTLDDGMTVTLSGDEAVQYVSSRNTDEFDSATKRLQHQKNYVRGYIKTAKKALQNNAGLSLDIYDTIKEYSLTNITSGEMLSLAKLLSDFDTADITIHSLEGTASKGEVYEEYYVDDTALLELVISIFYEKAGS